MGFTSGTVVDTRERVEIFNVRGHLFIEALRNCPEAHHNEISTTIERLHLKSTSESKIADIPSGIGEMSQEILRRYPKAKIFCVEPTEKFASHIDEKKFEVRRDLLNNLSLKDSSVDAVVSLAGLHHTVDRPQVYKEWRRILKPGGKLSVADVHIGSQTANFLNIFVDKHTPGGHDGLFFSTGEFVKQLGDAGFTKVQEEWIQVPWVFKNVDVMVEFCQTLFATRDSLNSAQMLAGIEKYLGWKETEAGVEMSWSLLFASAEVPANLENLCE